MTRVILVALLLSAAWFALPVPASAEEPPAVPLENDVAEKTEQAKAAGSGSTYPLDVAEEWDSTLGEVAKNVLRLFAVIVALRILRLLLPRKDDSTAATAGLPKA